TYNAALQTITFSPTGGYVGPASFAYTVSDVSGAISLASVNVTVNSPPPPSLTVTAGTQPVDFDQQPLFVFPYGTVSSLTSTSYQVNWGSSPFAYVVTGSDFSDTNADGRPDSGTINSISVYDGDGIFLFTMDGIN